MQQMTQVGRCCSIGAAAGSAAACAGKLGGAAFGIAEAGAGNCKIGGGAFAGIVEEAGAGKTVGGGAFAAGIVEEANNAVAELMGTGRHGGGCRSFEPEVPFGSYISHSSSWLSSGHQSCTAS